MCFSFADTFTRVKYINTNNGKFNVVDDYIKIPPIKQEIDYSKYQGKNSDKVVDSKDLNNNNIKPIPKIEEKILTIQLGDNGKNVETQELSNANKQIEQSQINVKIEDTKDSKNKNIESILEIEEEDKKSSHSDTLKSLGL